MAMSVYKMNLAQIIKFVELYRDEECLWDTNSEQYKDRIARDKALKRISDEMNISGFGPRQVAQKVKNIRSAYHQELKKIACSQESGASPEEAYSPKVPWFPVFDSFMKKVVQLQPLTAYQANRFSFLRETSRVCLSEDQSLSGSTGDCDKDSATFNSPVDCKKLKISDSPPPPLTFITEPISQLDENPSKSETEFDVWAKSLAIQLNNMDLGRALRLQLKIQALVTEDRIAHECS